MSGSASECGVSRSLLKIGEGKVCWDFVFAGDLLLESSICDRSVLGKFRIKGVHI